MRQLNVEAKTEKSLVIKLAVALLGFVIGISGSLLAGWFLQNVLDRILALVEVASILLLTIVGFFTGEWLEHRMVSIPIKKAAYWMLFSLISGSLVLATTLSWVYATLRPPITYFLIDATEQMKPFFGDVISQVSFSTVPNVKIGLSIYSGNTNGSIGCGSTKQLIEPNIYTNTRTKLESDLLKIDPAGHSSLLGAVFNTLNVLNKHDEPIMLVIITSGRDSQCDSPNGTIPQGLIGGAKSNINIMFISIGELGSRESNLLESYANELHGSYQNMSTPAQLSQTILTASSYRSQEYYYLYSKFTPISTP